MPDQTPDPNGSVMNTPSPDPQTPSTDGQTAPAQPSQSPQDALPDTSAPPQPSQSQGGPSQPQGGPSGPSQNGAMVSNPAPQVSQQGQQSIQRAGVLRTIAQTLAGGPRYQTTIDPTTGATTRTQIPLSRGDIGMAIVAEVLSGAMAGLSVKNGPGNEGRAAAAGFAQAQQERQQADAAQQAQAQTDSNNQTAALARQAQIFETNSRTALNTSEVEQRGIEAIDKAVDINRQSGILDTDADNVLNNGLPMTQDEMNDAMAKGTLSSLAQLGPLAGREQITNADGSTRWQGTHLIIKDGNAPVTITQADWDRYAANGVPGFPLNTKIGGDGVQVKQSMVQRANEIVASHYLANERLTDLRNVLDGTPMADKVPTSIDFRQPGVETAVQRFQKYVSHNAANLADPYTALQQMGADKRDPKTGQMLPNADAKYVDAAASAMGGWAVLEAAHNQLQANKQNAEKYSIIDSTDKANAVIASPKRFSADQVSAAKGFNSLVAQQGERKTADAARARAVADGSDTQAMYKFGKNPITGEVLSLTNAPPAMLVDSTGNVIPQDLVSTYKPTAQQRQTGDTARQVLSIASDLQAQVAQNPALIGPLSGNSTKAFAPLGIGTEAAQKMLDNVSLLQSAVTKMHTGRFSSEILKKSGNLIFPGMNGDQFAGAMDSLKDVAGRYTNEDRLTTVASYKAQQAQQQATQAQQQQPQPSPSTSPTSTAPQPSGTGRTGTPNPPNQPQTRTVQTPFGPKPFPPGAIAGRDAKGNIIGYRLNGQTVRY